jgi:N-acetylmuramoyl-L-alanine amidase
MKFETLMALVKRGQVTAQSVVRGPTTNQFWRVAAQVKGLSREFGVCYNCSTAVEKSATICPQCNRLQEPPSNPDVLLENAPAAAAPTSSLPAPTPSPAPSSAPAVVHREIKTPAPAPQPSPAPVPSRASAAVAVAAVDEVSKAMLGPAATAPKRTSSPSSSPRREPSASSREESPRSQRTDLLAPPASRSRRRSPRQRTAEDGILSAEDLATAFQLDFKPDARRAGGVRRALIVVVLLAISAGAIVLIVNQDYRDKARVWMSQKTTALRGMVTGRSSTKAVASDAPKAPVAPPAEQEVTPLTAAPATQPSPAVAPVSTPAPPASQPVAKAAPETKPSAPETKPLVPAPQITIAPVPRAEPTHTTIVKDTPATKDAPPSAKVAAAPVDSAAASKQAMTLWGQALDAEARRDYAKAVENYEAIKKLPKSTWPAGLEIRLALAKKRVK